MKPIIGIYSIEQVIILILIVIIIAIILLIIGHNLGVQQTRKTLKDSINLKHL